MNILQLYQDYNVPYSTEGPNCQAGWVNVQCPFCGDTSNHLGYNINSNYYHCWRCGGKNTLKTLSVLLNISPTTIKQIIKQYGQDYGLVKEPLIRIKKKIFKYPSNYTRLNTAHRNYLVSRNFDPDKLERVWGLLGLGPVSSLSTTNNKGELIDIDFKNRILAPIYWGGKTVSFQTRRLNDRDKLKYITCPKDREILFHKHILYGNQEGWKDVGICVEGITDVWRLGPYSFATFGIEYTPAQVRQIAKHFKHVYILFDNEPQADRQADKLIADLRFRNIQAERVKVAEKDPGSMKQSEANYLVKQLIKK